MIKYSAMTYSTFEEIPIWQKSRSFLKKTYSVIRNHLNIAKGSAGEVRAILYTLLDLEYITEGEFKELKLEIMDVSMNIANFRKFLLANKTRKK